MDAGLVYNTWPKMADKWIPDDLWAISPKWKNIFENPTTAQFDHRLLVIKPILLSNNIYATHQRVLNVKK